MKKLLAMGLMVLPLAINASIVTFECKSAETTGVHKFDAKGIVSIDDYNKADGIISIQTEKAQAEGSVQIFEEIKVSGTLQHFDAGDVTTSPFDQLTLFTKNTYIRNLNLLLDFKVAIASQIFSIDNFVYRSNCYTSQTTSHDK